MTLKDGIPFLDRDPQLTSQILNALNEGLYLQCTKEIHEELDFMGIDIEPVNRAYL